jgi:TolA-binding protein
MKKRMTFLALVLLAALGLVALAKDPSSPSKLVLPHYWSELGLSADQKQHVQAIQDEYRKKADGLRLQLRALVRKEREEMEKVLSDAQRARLKTLKERSQQEQGVKPIPMEN